MRWLRWFRRQKPNIDLSKIVINVPPHLRVDLTDEEVDFVNYTRGHCPLCRTGAKLCCGPCGGCAQNFRCAGCGQEVNLYMAPGRAIWGGERLARNWPHVYSTTTLFERWTSGENSQTS